MSIVVAGSFVAAEARAFLRARVDRAADGSWIFRPRGWVASPCEAGIHLTEADIDRLIAVAVPPLLLVPYEKPIDDSSPVYVVPLDYDGLRQMNIEWGLFDVVLVDRTRRWLLAFDEPLSTGIAFADDSLLLAALLGQDEASAIAEFIE